MNDLEPPLSILYQDAWLVAVNKPAGHLVHPAETPAEGDLVTMKILRDQIGQRVHPIHRLDRPTSGVLLFGIDKEVAHQLHKALERHEFQKIYWAIVNGVPSSVKWDCREPIQKQDQAPIRDAHTSFRQLISREPECLSEYSSPTISLIEATPHTGRYHQIRRHLLHANLPIVGDYRYAGIEPSDALGKHLTTGSRMLLQAKKLSLIHPATQEELIIETPIDPCFQKCFPTL
jgi:tRNA pseudouridine65 synthase